MKQAILTIITKQEGVDEDVKFTTRTECDETQNGIKLNYEESLAEGEDSVSTQLVIGEDSVLVERNGDTGSDMFFKKTTTYESQYKIIGGLCLDMKIFTTDLDIKSNESGVDANINYELFLGGSSVGSLGMNIKVVYTE